MITAKFTHFYTGLLPRPGPVKEGEDIQLQATYSCDEGKPYKLDSTEVATTPTSDHQRGKYT